MNVTVKIDDALCKAARHKAVDADLSLSGWVAQVIERELQREAQHEQTLVQALAMEDDRDLMEFIPDRNKEIERPTQFP